MECEYIRCSNANHGRSLCMEWKRWTMIFPLRHLVYIMIVEGDDMKNRLKPQGMEVAEYYEMVRAALSQQDIKQEKYVCTWYRPAHVEQSRFSYVMHGFESRGDLEFIWKIKIDDNNFAGGKAMSFYVRVVSHISLFIYIIDIYLYISDRWKVLWNWINVTISLIKGRR